jgi:WD40 repeat protein
MRLLKTAIGDIFALAFSPDGQALAAAVEDQGIFLWNLGSAGVPVRLDTDARKGTRVLVFFTPESRFVGWVVADGLKLYDRHTRRVAAKPLDTHGLLLRLVRTPDGSRIVSEHNFPQRTLIGWTAGPDGWEQDWSLSTRELAVRALAVDPAGERVAVLCQSAAGDRWWTRPVQVDLRSAVSGVVTATGSYPYDKKAHLVYAPDGSQLVAVHEMTLVVWPVPQLGNPRLVRNDSRQHFTDACYHPSGRFLIATSNDATVHVFDTHTWGRVSRFAWKIGRLRSVAISPDGTLAAASGDRGEVVVWDLDL